MIGIADLALEHRFHCHTSNYTNIDAAVRFETWSEFMDEFGDDDTEYIDYNLCFRWDIKPSFDENTDEPNGEYEMEVFFIQQNRGNFVPCTIDRVTDADVESIIAYLTPHLEYLTPHLEYLNNIWKPL